MAFSSGTFSRLHDWTTDRDAGIKIQASRMDSEMDGMATGLTTTMLKDGSQTLTAVIPFTLGLSLPTDKKVQLRDSAIYINSSADGQMDLVADTEIEVTAPTVDIAASTALTIATPSLIITDNTTDEPIVQIKNTHNGTTAGELRFVMDKGSAGADGDDLGTISFYGDDSGQNQTAFAKIVGEVSEADDTDEAGKLSFFVAESDGTNTALTAGLVLEGEHATDGEVDVTIGAGAASTTTVAGLLSLKGEVSVDAGNNKLYIGHSADQAYDASFTPVVQIAQVGNTVFGGLGLSHYSNDAEGAILVMGSGRATSVTGTTIVADGDTLGRIEFQGQDGGDFETGASIFGEVDGTPGANDMPGRLVFKTTADGAHSASERMRIHNSGDISIGRTTADTVNPGMTLEAAGTGVFVRDGGPCIIINRLSSDGEVIRINKDDTTIGTIAVDGSNVDYNTFLGSHWSRLTDNSRPTILRGTVMETIDDMCDWYQAEYTLQAEEKYADGDSIPSHLKVGDIKQDKIINKDSIALPEGKKVGDTITHTVDGVDYTAKILQEEDIKHAKCKVSDSADSKCVYGVFLRWDDDGAIVNDLRVASVGTYVVRIHKDQTVAKGDLLSSNGDGTAKKQSDDIIRSKTIGKVLTNIKQETYDDGSYIVPCALYCG